MIAEDLSHGQVGTAGIGLAFGLAVMAVIWLFGRISGAHINPAVTISLCAIRQFPGKHVLPYVFSQCAGAICASAILSGLFPFHPTLGATIPAGSPAQSFFLEIFLTFLLVLAILAFVFKPIEKRIATAMMIGAVIGLESTLAGPISGASMNPARSLGPAVMSGQLEHLWIYLVAPTIGALAAVPPSMLIFARHRRNGQRLFI